jgi:hypothetical protein
MVSKTSARLLGAGDGRRRVDGLDVIERRDVQRKANGQGRDVKRKFKYKKQTDRVGGGAVGT